MKQPTLPIFQRITGSWLVRLLFTALALATMIYFAPIREWREVIQQLQYVPAILSGSMIVAVGILDAIRMVKLLPELAQHRFANLAVTFKSGLVAQLPIGIPGGDLYRGYGLCALGIPIEKAVSAIAVARLTGFSATLALGLISIVLLLIQSDTYSGVADGTAVMLITTLSCLLLVAGGLFLMIRKAPTDWFLPKRFAKVANQIKSHSEMAIASLLILSALMVILRTASLYFAATALSVSISPVIIATALCTGFVLSLIPLSFAGIGFREGGISGVLAMFGTPLPVAIIIAVAHRLIIITATVLGLLIAEALLGLLKTRRGARS